MVSYRVDIATKRNPAATACTPRFEVEREAFAYARYLIRRHHFITRALIEEDLNQEPNATFQAGRLAWMPDDGTPSLGTSSRDESRRNET